MRKYFIALVAVVAVLITVAFTPDTTKKDKKAVLTTYYYTGDDSYSQQTNETLYIKNPGSIPNCPDQGAIVCKIVTSSDEGTNPDFSSNRNPVDLPNLFSSVVKKPSQP